MTLLKANAEPGGRIRLHLNSLENKNNASGCCSGCAAQCNYQLEIWTTCDINKKNNSDCLYGYSKTGIFSRNTSSIFFGESLGNGLWNPLAHDFSFYNVRFTCADQVALIGLNVCNVNFTFNGHKS